jgi:hypothetical protein
MLMHRRERRHHAEELMIIAQWFANLGAIVKAVGSTDSSASTTMRRRQTLRPHSVSSGGFHEGIG